MAWFCSAAPAGNYSVVDKRVGELSRLAQGDNLIVLHGVSILIWMCGWVCHRHDTPPPLFRAVTNFSP
jgi:hypothetical protein